MFTRLAAALVSTLVLSNTGRSQCHEWAHDFATSGIDGVVYAYATFDDGHGPALYVGGSFGYAGEQLTSGIARWDGTHWAPVGGGVQASVRALAVYDDGSGPALYAGGSFDLAGGTVVAHGVAKWDGTSWSALVSGGVNGTSGPVHALCVYDDGAGAKLYAAGNFMHAGGQLANNIARWSSAGWEAFTSGADGYPQALTVFDEGSGPKLVVAGQFTQCGSVFASNLAQYDGTGFAPLGQGTNGAVAALCVFDDGTGPALVAGGTFTHAGGAYVSQLARWRNGGWAAVGGGLPGAVASLASYDEGSGARLFVGGAFTQAGGQPARRLARWDGTAWSVPGALDQLNPIGGPPSLGVHDDGSGPRLYLGTDVRVGSGSWTHGIASWNGVDFDFVGPARNNVLDGTVEGFAVYDDGTGAALYATGTFGKAGGNLVNRVARWNGARWSPLAGGLATGYSYPPLTVVDHGSGPQLYAHVDVPNAGGNYSELWRWDGVSWSTVLATNPGTQIWATGVYDDGSGAALYVGGNFHSLGGVAATGIARFDGSNWSAVGGGIDGSNPAFGPSVFAVHDDGSGPVLVVGGLFETAGGQPALHVARWNGTSWSAFGAGLISMPTSFATFDDGSGARLFAGCSPQAQGILQRWDGSAWSYVAGGPNNWVHALAVFDDGSGPALYAGGSFSFVGSTVAHGFARWNGSAWSVPGDGVMLGGSSGAVRALQVFDDGTGGGPDLFVGGNFSNTGGVRSAYIGKWRGCNAPIASFCHGDGGDLPCPCWNNGASGHGCANSANAAGAQLSWSGSTNPDTLVLASSGELASALSIFLQGSQQTAHVPFGDGLRCVSGTLKRLYVRNASGGSVSAPLAGEPSIRARSAALGDTILSGTSRGYQVYYRDPQAAFCSAPTGGSFNITNGVVVHW